MFSLFSNLQKTFCVSTLPFVKSFLLLLTPSFPNKEFRRFLEISRGSLFELQTQLYISKELGFIECKSYDMIYEQSREVERILIGFINSLKV